MSRFEIVCFHNMVCLWVSCLTYYIHIYSFLAFIRHSYPICLHFTWRTLSMHEHTTCKITTFLTNTQEVEVDFFQTATTKTPRKQLRKATASAVANEHLQCINISFVIKHRFRFAHLCDFLRLLFPFPLPRKHCQTARDEQRMSKGWAEDTLSIKSVNF